MLGYFKEENAPFFPNLIPYSFVGLNSKVYSLLLTEGKEGGEHVTQDRRKLACKGVKKHIAKRYLSHEIFKECLFNEKVVTVQTNHIRSKSHKLYTVREKKIALCAYDSKRFISLDRYHTYAFGSCMIQNDKQE